MGKMFADMLYMLTDIIITFYEFPYILNLLSYCRILSMFQESNGEGIYLGKALLILPYMPLPPTPTAVRALECDFNSTV